MVSAYIFYIVIATFLVQSLNSAEFNNINTGFYKDIHPRKSNEPIVRRFVSNKNDISHKDLFINDNYNNLNEIMPQLIDIKSLLLKLLDRIDTDQQKRNVHHQVDSKNKRTVWGHWTNWSSCSVSCGKGREIRYRRCLRNCQGIETEMAEKICQLPACGSKLFGLIKL